MQFSITDDAAITFAKAFYEAIAQGRPVDNAIAEGRKDIYAEHDLEFATPVLFMRVADGRLFDITAPHVRTAIPASKPASEPAVRVPRVGKPSPSTVPQSRPPKNVLPRPAIGAKPPAKPPTREQRDDTKNTPTDAPFVPVWSFFDQDRAKEPATGAVAASRADAAAPATSTGQDGYSAFLVRYPESNKSDVVRVVRTITNLDLKGARSLVATPNPILRGISKKEAESIKARLEEFGATVEVVEPGKPLPGSRKWNAVRLPAAFVRLRVILGYDVHVLDFRMRWTDTLHVDGRLIERKFITGSPYKFALQDGPHSRAAKLMTNDGITLIVDDRVLFQGPYGSN